MKALVPTPPSRTSQGPRTGSCSTLLYTRSSSWREGAAREAPHLVTFEKAQALSSTEALGLEASGDGVLADIEAVFSSNLSGRKATASSDGSQDGILRSPGEFLQSAY